MVQNQRFLEYVVHSMWKGVIFTLVQLEAKEGTRLFAFIDDSKSNFLIVWVFFDFPAAAQCFVEGDEVEQR